MRLIRFSQLISASLTRVITDSMNEMAAGAVQISNAVNEVAEITKKII